MRATLLIVILGLVLVSPATAQTESLESYLETVRAKYDLPALAAAVVKDGEIVAAGAIGTRVYGMDIPVTIDDRFHIGSITKSMTATLAGMMVDEGKLRWDSTIGEVLGDDVEDMNPTLSAVTLSQLLSHSSGLPRDTLEMFEIYRSAEGFNNNLPDLRLVALDAWKANELIVPHGSPFRYSNFGYIIAAAMIEKVSGLAWEELLRERLFSPLGQVTAGFGPQATTGLYDAPVGHMFDEDGDVIPVPWGPVADLPPIMAPAGLVHMSILDLAKWASWNAAVGQREPALVSVATLVDIQESHVETPTRHTPPRTIPPDGGYGFGWLVLQLTWANKVMLYHEGTNDRNFAAIAVDTYDDAGVVAMTNMPDEDAAAAIREVIKHMYLEYVPQ